VQRFTSGDYHLRALVSDGDPRLKLAAQVKDLHAVFRTIVAMSGQGWGASFSEGRARFRLCGIQAFKL